MHTIKELIKKLVPKNALLVYHWFLAVLGQFIYGFPSKRMIVVGITGTKGKTSTAFFLGSVLNAAGKKTGLITTAAIKIGAEEFLNPYHMTMPGRFAIPRLMRKMVKAGCSVCVMEATSEGMKQWRHAGIDFDAAIFTNLTPEHLRSHGGSFEEYKKMKGRLFATLSRSRTKKIGGVIFPKTIIANADSEHASYFLSFPAERKITYGTLGSPELRIKIGEQTQQGIAFEANGGKFRLALPGKLNVMNAAPAIIVGRLFSLSDALIKEGLLLPTIPGRMEKIEGGNRMVFVDYAHEKESMGALIATASALRKPNGKILVLLGAEGGGRDIQKRFDMGKIVGEQADIVVVSNVDPYDDAPQKIAEDIANEAVKAGKLQGENLFVVLDRREGIQKILSLAGPNDIVVISGKGAEQSMIIKGKKIPWDDRVVVREELKKI